MLRSANETSPWLTGSSYAQLRISFITSVIATWYAAIHWAYPYLLQRRQQRWEGWRAKAVRRPLETVIGRSRALETTEPRVNSQHAPLLKDTTHPAFRSSPNGVRLNEHQRSPQCPLRGPEVPCGETGKDCSVPDNRSVDGRVKEVPGPKTTSPSGRSRPVSSRIRYLTWRMRARARPTSHSAVPQPVPDPCRAVPGRAWPPESSKVR